MKVVGSGSSSVHTGEHVDEQRGTYMPGVTNCELTYSRGVARELPVESCADQSGCHTGR